MKGTHLGLVFDGGDELGDKIKAEEGIGGLVAGGGGDGFELGDENAESRQRHAAVSLAALTHGTRAARGRTVNRSRASEMTETNLR